jgi:succinate dehydrogenase / fumarate reductase, cytochrome b subunit
MNAFFLRHEFLIRRLHSLSGIVPVGAYMTVHLLVNSSLLLGVERFQTFVFGIHSLGAILPLVEWSFIFLPIIFHAVVGVWIAQTGQPNSQKYGYGSNIRYTWQRYSGYIAMVFIFMHVFHLHGWFHADWWIKNIAEPISMAQFRPYNAASTLATALSGIFWPIFYFVGVVACCYHLANGLWTAGITWGVWVSQKGQERALRACGAFGILLTVLGLSSLFAAKKTDAASAASIENRMYEASVETGAVPANEQKRTGSHAAIEGPTAVMTTTEPAVK